MSIPPHVRLMNAKQLGEYAQLVFMARAAGEGLLISEPYGDSRAYDVGVEYYDAFRRIQIKSTLEPRRGEAFRLGLVGPGGMPYHSSQIDAVAAYLVAIRRWYILPFDAIRDGDTEYTQRNIQIHPDSDRNKWHHYAEAWHLLRRPISETKEK